MDASSDDLITTTPIAPPLEASDAAPDGAGPTEPAPLAPPLTSGPPGAEVEVTLDTSNPVTMPPPQNGAAPAPAASPTPTPPPEGNSMRVVRRRIRNLGGDEGGSAHPPAIDAAAVAPIPAARLPRVAIPEFAPDAAPARETPASAPVAPAAPVEASPEAARVSVPSVVPAAPVVAAPVVAAPTAAAPPATAPVPLATVPRTEEIVRRPSQPPPPPRRSAAPLPLPASPTLTTSGPRVLTPPSPQPASASIPPPLPPSSASMPPAAAPVLSSAPPAVTTSADDESVEVSLDDGHDHDGPRRSTDPSLAMLDELAEMAPDGPAEALDADAIEHVEAAAAPRSTSMPPPPPRDAAQGKGKAPPPMKITGMPTVQEPRSRRRRMWWEELFNDDYFRTMERLSPAQAQTEAEWIEHALGVETGAAILDVACGAGRQAIELAKRRYDVVALDLSLPMLTRASDAAQDASAKLTFAHCDMAAMEYSEVFDAAYCVGSSFGFFDDPRNAEVVRRIHKALKPHGTFLLGVLNRDHAIQRQPAMSWFEGDGCVCMEESTFNFITSRLNVKRTMIFDDGRQREFEYSTRLYSLHELGQVLHEAGFRILEVSGHARTPGAFFGPTSRELIILAQKRGPEVVEFPPSQAPPPYDGASDSSKPS